MDERLKIYEEKMTKSYDAMIREFTAIRLLRNSHTDSAGGQYFRTGAQNAADSALGEEPD